MKKTLFVIVGFLCLSTLSAQTEIIGTVNDTSGISIADANVIISGAISVFDNDFAFSLDFRDSQIVRVSYLNCNIL